MSRCMLTMEVVEQIWKRIQIHAHPRYFEFHSTDIEVSWSLGTILWASWYKGSNLYLLTLIALSDLIHGCFGLCESGNLTKSPYALGHVTDIRGIGAHLSVSPLARLKPEQHASKRFSKASLGQGLFGASSALWGREMQGSLARHQCTLSPIKLYWVVISPFLN